MNKDLGFLFLVSRLQWKMKTRVKPRLVSQSTSVCVLSVFSVVQRNERRTVDRIPVYIKEGIDVRLRCFFVYLYSRFSPHQYITSLPFETHFCGSLCPVFSSSSATGSTGRRQTASSSLPGFLLRCHVAVHHIYILVITKVYLILSFFFCECDKSDFPLQLSVYTVNIKPRKFSRSMIGFTRNKDSAIFMTVDQVVVSYNYHETRTFIITVILNPFKNFSLQ